MNSAETFRNNIIEAGYVIDRDGVHTEFANDDHGQKIDFDSIPKDSELFEEWVDVTAETILDRYCTIPLDRLLIVSVANGTNRLIEPVAESLGNKVHTAYTRKLGPKNVVLTDESKELIAGIDPLVTVLLEDVGTTGSTSLSAAGAVLEAGVDYVEVLNAWQRTPYLEKLIGAKITYGSIINEPLPTYNKKQCETFRLGFCNQGWDLIEKKRAA